MITRRGDLVAVIKIRVHLGASAAKGTFERQGIGKVRHVEVDVLWIQEQQARARLPLIKVDGSWNPADLKTNNLARSDVIETLGIMV